MAKFKVLAQDGTTNGTIAWEDVLIVFMSVADRYGFYDADPYATMQDFVVWMRGFLNTYNNNQILNRLPRVKTTQEILDITATGGSVNMTDILSIFEAGCIEKGLYQPVVGSDDGDFIDFLRVDFNSKSPEQILQEYMQ
jgi:hypothetical protein